MSISIKKSSGMGKYQGFHGIIRIGEAAPASPVRGAIGKGGGKTTNYPMDSDEAFAKRLKHYEARKQAEQEAYEAAGSVEQDAGQVPA